MNRIVEPELMDDDTQAVAYAQADFSEAHQSYVRLFAQCFPDAPADAVVLDIGCGAADVTLRFAEAYPRYTFHAVDGSAAMLACAQQAISRRPGVEGRLRLIKGFIPGAALPQASYDVILSNSFLHHLHRPEGLWETIQRHARPGTLIFITDLFRPASAARAEEMVETYAGGEPEILKRDFLNSLLAAFTPEEIQAQLRAAKLDHLKLDIVSDRHFIISGAAR